MQTKMALFFILLFISGLYAKEDTSRPLNKEIIKNLDMLESSDAYQRHLAAERLVLTGSSVIEYIAKNFSQKHYLARRKMVYILGKIGNEAAINLLISVLRDRDEGIRTRASLSLLELLDTNPKILVRLKKIKPKNESVKDLLETINFKRVEQELSDLISPQGGFGFYDGQFNNLKKIGIDAVLPLLEMFKEREYRCIHIALNKEYERRYKMRILAGEALAEFPKMSKKLRKKVLRTLRRMRHDRDNEIKEIVAYALYQLGERAEFNKKLKAVRNRIAKNPKYADAYYDLGMLYLRVRNSKEGIKALERSAILQPSNALTHYNLACAYSCAHLINKAVLSLQRSVLMGYNDVGWLKLDGDLKNIRKDPRYKALVRRLEKQLKK